MPIDFSNLEEETMSDDEPKGFARSPRRTGKARDKVPRTRTYDSEAESVPNDVAAEDVSKIKEPATDRKLKPIENDLLKWAAMGQVFLIVNNDYYCANALGVHAPPMAKSLAIIAEDFPLIKQLIATSDKWGALAILVYHGVQLGATIAVHHEKLPYDNPIMKFLVPPPPGTLTVEQEAYLRQVQENVNHQPADPSIIAS